MEYALLYTSSTQQIKSSVIWNYTNDQSREKVTYAVLIAFIALISSAAL